VGSAVKTNCSADAFSLIVRVLVGGKFLHFSTESSILVTYAAIGRYMHGGIADH
jgi:hypothetical protein